MTWTFGRADTFTWLAWACRGLLAGVFLFAAVPKLLDLDAFASIIDAYGILPDRYLVPIAVVLVFLELVGGLGLFFKRGQQVSLTIILCLLLFFVLVLGYGLWLGLDIDCGCFGHGEPEYKFFSNLKVALVRDLFLLLPVAYLFWYGRSNRIWDKEDKQNDCREKIV